MTRNVNIFLPRASSHAIITFPSPHVYCSDSIPFKGEYWNEFSFLAHELLKISVILVWPIFGPGLSWAVFGFPGFSGCLCFLLLGVELCLLHYVPGIGRLLLNVSPACHPVCFLLLKHTYVQLWLGAVISHVDLAFLMQPSVFPRLSSCLYFLHSMALPLSTQLHYPVYGRDLGFRNEGCCKC